MDSAARILDIAERRMRQFGYNAVSYRDIAAEMGIRSASLHYHFPKKEDLGVSLVQRYSQDFQSRLDAKVATLSSANAKLSAFIDLYRYALKEQRLVCLCAVLGAESPGLPTSVSNQVKQFFDQNIAWLTECYRAAGVEAPPDHATTTLALLEGAMIVSSVKSDVGIFEVAATMIQASLVRRTD